MGRTLQEIKDEYAREVGFDDWNEIEYSHTGDEISHHWNIVSKRFAIEVSREALKNASEDFENNWDFGCESNKEISNSLLSERYIPKI